MLSNSCGYLLHGRIPAQRDRHMSHSGGKLSGGIWGRGWVEYWLRIDKSWWGKAVGVSAFLLGLANRFCFFLFRRAMNGLSRLGSGYGTKEISCCACVVPEQTKPSKGATTARNVAHWTTPTRTKDQRSHASFQEQWRLHETISCAREKYHLCQPTGNRHYLQGNRNVFFLENIVVRGVIFLQGESHIFGEME